MKGFYIADQGKGPQSPTVTLDPISGSQKAEMTHIQLQNLTATTPQSLEPRYFRSLALLPVSCKHFSETRPDEMYTDDASEPES